MFKYINLLSVIFLATCTQTNEWTLKEYAQYNGPYLEESYFEIEDLYTTIGYDMYGTGKAFEVTLNYVVDGDTARFYTDYDIYKSSFRFFNIDTNESTTYEEEWGKPASMYTKNKLENAYSIALQTDISDGILDNYDRGLVWVWVKDTEDSSYELLNYKLVANGLAKVQYLYGAGEDMYYNDISYVDYLLDAQSKAKENKYGMYSNLIDPYWDYENDKIYKSI